MGQLEPEGLTNDMVRLFRRPSIAPTEEVRRRTQAELTSLEVQLSESSKTRISTLSPNTEQKRETETGYSTYHYSHLIFGFSPEKSKARRD